MFVEGKSRTVFFPSDTLIYGISRDGSKNYNIRTCEHMILGQLRMGARQTNYAPLVRSNLPQCLGICHNMPRRRAEKADPLDDKFKVEDSGEEIELTKSHHKIWH